jgi:hypothetical protein
MAMAIASVAATSSTSSLLAPSQSRSAAASVRTVVLPGAVCNPRRGRLVSAQLRAGARWPVLGKFNASSLSSG